MHAAASSAGVATGDHPWVLVVRVVRGEVLRLRLVVAHGDGDGAGRGGDRGGGRGHGDAADDRGDWCSGGAGREILSGGLLVGGGAGVALALADNFKEKTKK